MCSHEQFAGHRYFLQGTQWFLMIKKVKYSVMEQDVMAIIEWSNRTT